jgi:4-hydroxybenzoate polyprenyltransferase
MNAAFRQKRTPYSLRILAVLSLVHWKNILLTILAQYSAALFSLSGDPMGVTLLNPELHLIVLATACIIAGGFIINAFYDYEKDLINHPEKTIFNRLISKSFAFRSYILLNVSGLLLALLASFNIFLFFAAFSVALWLYSHKLQKMVFIREISAVVLSITSFFSIVIYFRHLTGPMLLYGFVFSMLLGIRGIIKNIRGYRGDVAMGYETVTVAYGLRKSIQAAGVMHLLAITGIGLLLRIPFQKEMLLILWVLFGLVMISALGHFLDPVLSRKVRYLHALSTLTIAIAALSAGGITL